MAKFIKHRAKVPDRLATFEPKVWIRQALNADDEYLRTIAECHTRAQVLKNYYAIVVIAPVYYRTALRNEMGVEDGDAYFFATNIYKRAHQFAKRASNVL